MLAETRHLSKSVLPQSTTECEESLISCSQTQVASGTSGDLLKPKLLGAVPQSSELVGLREGWRTCISIQFPGDAHAASPRATLWEQLL